MECAICHKEILRSDDFVSGTDIEMMPFGQRKLGPVAWHTICAIDLASKK